MQRLNASELRELLRAATLRLEQRASAIDRLNVFPVPDGDTGSNMVYGMRSGLQEADLERAAEACAVAAAFARGALAGARGSSGLILSQLWRGLAEGAQGARTLGVEELSRGLAAGSALAYRAVARPVSGTILTVMQEVAQAAQNADGSLSAFLRQAGGGGAGGGGPHSVAPGGAAPLRRGGRRGRGAAPHPGGGLALRAAAGGRACSREEAGLGPEAGPELSGPRPAWSPEAIAPLTDRTCYGICTEFLPAGPRVWTRTRSARRCRTWAIR